MNKFNVIRFGFSLILGSVFIYLIFRQIDYNDIAVAFMEFNSLWLLLSCLAYGFEYFLRIKRWQVMLRTYNSTLSWKECSMPLLLSYAINAVLPFRAGDAVRCFGFTRKLQTRSGVVVATVFVERILDFLFILAILAIVLSVFHFDIPSFLRISGFALLLICGFFLGILLFPKQLFPVSNVARIILVFLFPRHEAKFNLEFSSLNDTLQRLSRSYTMLKLIGFSASVWIMECFVFLFVAQAMTTLHQPKAALLALPMGTLATLIPSTPGYIGTFDYFVVQSLVLVGNTNAASIVYAMIIHLILWIPPALLGVIYLLFRLSRK